MVETIEIENDNLRGTVDAEIEQMKPGKPQTNQKTSSFKRFH